MDEASRKYLTVNTHKVLFQPTRLQYGIHSVAGIFQREMEKRLSHVPFAVLRMDDILILGKMIIDIMKKCRLRLKKKCVFVVSEVIYLGFRINKNGVFCLPKKVTDLLNAETPKNTAQFTSFMGMINYHRHLPNLVHILKPLH